MLNSFMYLSIYIGRFMCCWFINVCNISGLSRFWDNIFGNRLKRSRYNLSNKNVGGKGTSYSRDDIKITSMLLMCLVTVMICAVSIISIYEEKSLFDIIQDVASEAEYILTDGKSEMVKIEEGDIPLSDGSGQPVLNAKKNNYDLSNLYEDDLYRYYFEDEQIFLLGGANGNGIDGYFIFYDNKTEELFCYDTDEHDPDESKFNTKKAIILKSIVDTINSMEVSL